MNVVKRKALNVCTTQDKKTEIVSLDDQLATTLENCNCLVSFSVFFRIALYLLRKLSYLRVSQQIKELGNKSIVECVSTFLLPARYGHLNFRAQNTFFNGKIKQKALDSAFTERTQRKVRGVLADSSRPLFCQFEPLSSWRRYRAPMTAG